MAERAVLVTGASRGIGRAVAQAVLKMINPPAKGKKHGLAATARNWATSATLLSLCDQEK